MIETQRQQHWNAFLNQGLPTRSDERWKYTDLSFLKNKKFSIDKRVNSACIYQEVNKYRLQQGESILLVLVNGCFAPALSDIQKLPKNILVSNFNEALIKHPDLINQFNLTKDDIQNYPFANINSTMREDGLFLYIPDRCEITVPVHLLSLASDEEALFQPYHFVVLGDYSKLTLIEEHRGGIINSYMANIVSNITMGRHAKLEHIKIQAEGKDAIHMATTFIKQNQNSSVKFANFSSGSSFARDDLVVRLLEQGAECFTAGLYRLKQDNQYIDHHVDIAHIAPRSKSEMLYKGVINKKSRAVFNGKLHVDKNAQKTLAYQANHNLLLSSEAEVYSKPELEIYADDVKCKHGATTGQLNQEALFYLRARGIEYTEAMNLLLQGFAEEIIQRVANAEIRRHVQENLL